MSGLRLGPRAEEEAGVTYAPAVAALGMLLAAVFLTVWRPGALLGAALVAASVGWWMRESRRDNPGLVPPEVARGEAAAGGPGAVSLYGWAAVGFGAVQLLFVAAALRVANAHGLLDPRLPDLPVRPLLGHAGALAALAALAAAAWAARRTRAGASAAPALLAVAAAQLVLLALLAAQLAAFAEGPVFPDSRGRTSAAWLALGIHVPFLAGSLASVLLMWTRMRGVRAASDGQAAARAVALYAAVTAVAWLALWAVFWLRLLRLESHLI